MSCSFYKFESSFFGGDYYCMKKEETVSSDIYYKYCRDYNYDACPIYKSNSSSSSCFITTISCSILGKKDNNKVLTNIRFLREEVLKKNEQYFSILMDYDYIGPLIACSIDSDPKKEEMASQLYENVLSKVSELIDKKEYQTAIDSYQKMVLSLIEYYGLKEFYMHFKENNYDLNTFNIKESGHGRVLKKR